MNVRQQIDQVRKLLDAAEESAARKPLQQEVVDADGERWIKIGIDGGPRIVIPLESAD